MRHILYWHLDKHNCDEIIVVVGRLLDQLSICDREVPNCMYLHFRRCIYIATSCCFEHIRQLISTCYHCGHLFVLINKIKILRSLAKTPDRRLIITPTHTWTEVIWVMVTFLSFVIMPTEGTISPLKPNKCFTVRGNCDPPHLHRFKPDSDTYSDFDSVVVIIPNGQFIRRSSRYLILHRDQFSMYHHLYFYYYFSGEWWRVWWIHKVRWFAKSLRYFKKIRPETSSSSLVSMFIS